MMSSTSLAAEKLLLEVLMMSFSSLEMGCRDSTSWKGNGCGDIRIR
jgi:hypothetical protein